MNAHRRWMTRFLAVLLATVLVTSLAGGAGAEGYKPITGEGSSWAGNAIAAMQVNVRPRGMDVDYNPSGSSAGRKNFLNGTVDFAASDIPFQFHPEDNSDPENPAPGSYAYIPVVAGGTAFMYNLRINGQRVTNLRLSGENIAKIFTGAITMWNDPALQADNPGLVLPGRSIVPIVRADGSGSTAQFTMWMINRHPQIWNDYCQRSGRAPKCGFTSNYPTVAGMIAQNGDLGVTNYVTGAGAEGAIGYVNYSYAVEANFPVAKVLNAAGYYTEPTPRNVAVSLLRAEINDNASDPSVYLTQKLDNVYTDPDPRNYQLSSYSYFILRTVTTAQFTDLKGRTLGAFAYYAMCQAQQQSEDLGYSPLPINLVRASLDQIKKIPGVEVQNVNVESCDNPTFTPDGHNRLVDEAAMPLACDRQGIPTQCEDGTAGAPGKTPVTGGGNAYGTPGSDGAGGGGASSGGDGAVGGASSGGDGAGGGASSGGDGSGSNPSGSGSNPGAVNPGGDGSGASTSTTVAAGALDPTATTVATATVCDPDTGVCAEVPLQGSGGGDVNADGAASGAQRPVGAVLPTTLEDDGGWGWPQTLMVIVVVVLAAAVVVVPAVSWRRLSLRGARS